VKAQPGQLLQTLPRQIHLKETKGILSIHFHVHQMQQPLNFLETHPTILIFVATLKPIPQPSRSKSRQKALYMCIYVCSSVYMFIH
jgi:hypothetical protein